MNRYQASVAPPSRQSTFVELMIIQIMPNGAIRDAKETTRVAISGIKETNAGLLFCTRRRHDLAVPSGIRLPLSPIVSFPLLGGPSQCHCQLHRRWFRGNGLPEPLARLVNHQQFSQYPCWKFIPNPLVVSSYRLYGICGQLLGSFTTCKMGRLGTVASSLDVQSAIHRCVCLALLSAPN